MSEEGFVFACVFDKVFYVCCVFYCVVFNEKLVGKGFLKVGCGQTNRDDD